MNVPTKRLLFMIFFLLLKQRNDERKTLDFLTKLLSKKVQDVNYF
jgi:hypothetical protein